MNKNTTAVIMLLATCLLSFNANALPDDDQQELIIVGGPGEFDFNLGIVVLHGTLDEPVVITQGSLVITGQEVTLERVNGLIHKITALGELAHYQQQPELDEGIIYANGEAIVFNNTDQLLTIDRSAEIVQNGDTLSGCHIDYNLDTGKGNIQPCEDGERLRIVLPPGTRE